VILACLSRSSKRSSRIRSSRHMDGVFGTYSAQLHRCDPQQQTALPLIPDTDAGVPLRREVPLCRNLRARRGLHHRPQRTSSSERQAEEYSGHTAACSATVCNECGDSCDIRVVTPDLGDAEDEPSLSAGESTQTASTAGRARRLCYPSSWRAAPCGPVPIVFQEKKSSCDVPVPSGP
jgi:hypothetical protein